MKSAYHFSAEELKCFIDY